ncbi:MAG: LysR family transcriptional regulator [Janthinobacterium lividum]
MSAITLRQLEIFVHAVEAGSFRRCAERTGMTQVSVSDHVRSLEQALGRSLFDRRAGAPATISGDGRRAYVHACEIVRRIERLHADLDSGVVPRRRTVAVGAHAYILSRLSAAAADFALSHPELAIEMIETTYEQLVVRLDAGVVDVGYFFSFGDQFPEASEVVAQSEIAVFVAPTHPLARAGKVDAATLLAAPIVHINRRAHLRGLLDRALASVGIVDPPVAVESDNFRFVLDCTARGLGYMCVFEQSITPGMGFHKLDLSFVLPSFELRRTVRLPGAPGPEVQAVLDWLAVPLQA